LRSSRICRKCRALIPALLLVPMAWGIDPNRPIGHFLHRRWDRALFPGGEIHAIAQTADGYLWVGAQYGLFRFDGVNFRAVDFSPVSPHGAAPVVGLRADTAGGLWVLLQSPGLLRYYGGAFQTPIPGVTVDNPVTAMGQGVSGDVLVSRPGGPLRYKDGRLQTISPVAGGLGIAIAETADGSVWIGTRDEGLYRIHNGTVTSIAGLPDRKIDCLDPSAHGDLWIGTDSGLAYWDGTRLAPGAVPLGLAHRPIISLGHDSDSNTWVGTLDGLARIDRGGNLAWEPADETRARPVNAIFEDRERNLWVGRADGLEQYRDTAFFSYEPTSRGVAGNEGPVFVDGSGRAWYGPSSGGLAWIQGNDRGSVKQFGNDVVYSLCGGEGEVWAGTRQSGVIQILREGPAYSVRPFTATHGLAKGPVVAVYRQNDGTLWAGTLNGGLSQIQNGRITTYSTSNGLASNTVTAIEQTADGTLWAATSNGMQAFVNGRWQALINQDELPPGRINLLREDRSGVLWVGTDSGLAFLKGARLVAVHNAPAGLESQILGLEDDGRGYLWIVTNSHVFRILRAALLGGPSTGAREFGVADGLPSTEGIRRSRSIFLDSTERLWLSLGGGLSVVDPARLAAASPPAAVHIEDVTVDGERMTSWKDLQVPSGRRKIVFDYIGLSLAAPERVRYQYRLDPFDSGWSEPSEARQVAYTNLGPGRYRFRLVASNSDGLWNGTEVAVNLRVTPHLWQALWFQFAAGFAVLLGAFGVYRLHIHQVAARFNLRFEERLAERTRVARDLHDTLLQSVQGLMLHLQVVDDMLPPGEAKEELEHTLERADQAIAEGRSAVYDLRSSTTTTNDLPEALNAAGAELVTGGSPAFRLIVEGSSRAMHPLIRDEVYRIAREALRNAFSHAHASRIEVELLYADRLFRLRIRDDGNGIPPEILERGRPGHFGLSAMRERARQVGARLTILSAAGAGAEVELSIPSSIAYRKPPAPSRFWPFRRKQD